MDKLLLYLTLLLLFAGGALIYTFTNVTKEYRFCENLGFQTGYQESFYNPHEVKTILCLGDFADIGHIEKEFNVTEGLFSYRRIN